MIYEQTPSNRGHRDEHEKIEISLDDDAAYLIYIFSDSTHVSEFFFYLKFFSFYFLLKQLKAKREFFMVVGRAPKGWKRLELCLTERNLWR